MTPRSVPLQVAAVRTGRQAVACFCLGILVLLEALAACSLAVGRGWLGEKGAAPQIRVQQSRRFI